MNWKMELNWMNKDERNRLSTVLRKYGKTIPDVIRYGESHPWTKKPGWVQIGSRDKNEDVRMPPPFCI